MIRALSLLLLALAPLAEASSLQVVGKLVREARLDAGQATAGVIRVRNTGAEPMTVLIAQQDYTFQADGSNAFTDPGSHPRSNAAWITFSPRQVQLLPGGTAEVSYQMRAPIEPVEAGTYWSTLVVEPASDPLEERERTVQVRTVIRYAIQLIADVGHDAPVGLAFDDLRMLAVDGGAALEVDLSNPGARGLVPEVSVQVHDASGASVGTFAGRRARIHPGCSARFRVPFLGLSPGLYQALVVADAGADALFGARTTFEIRAPEATATLAER